MIFITDKVITAQQFVECYTGKCFMDCDTLTEAKNCLASAGIHIGRGLRLTEMFKDAAKNYSAVLVEFSSPDDYNSHEYRVMRIQNKYLCRFISNMSEDGYTYED